jgi:hypothetical protein
VEYTFSGGYAKNPKKGLDERGAGLGVVVLDEGTGVEEKRRHR